MEDACVWISDGEYRAPVTEGPDVYETMWTSGCGVIFWCQDTPEDEGYKYCPNCSREIEWDLHGMDGVDPTNDYTLIITGETLELLRALQDADDTTPEDVIATALHIYDAVRRDSEL